MTGRLTRQEIKRDEVLESLRSTATYLWLHPKTILIALSALVAVILGVAMVVHLRHQRIERANAALTEAVRAFDEAADDEDARQDALAALQQIADTGGSAGPAAVARMILAADAARQGESEHALALWEQVAERPGTALAAQAEINLIGALRASGRGEEIVGRLQRELQSRKGALPPDIILAELATTLDALERPEEAEAMRTQLREQHPESVWVGAGAS